MLAVQDLVAQVWLFMAEVQHDSAIQCVHAARQEIERSVALAKHTKGRLVVARENARVAALHVRRWRERSAMGLR